MALGRQENHRAFIIIIIIRKKISFAGAGSWKVFPLQGTIIYIMHLHGVVIKRTL